MITGRRISCIIASFPCSGSFITRIYVATILNLLLVSYLLTTYTYHTIHTKQYAQRRGKFDCNKYKLMIQFHFMAVSLVSANGFVASQNVHQPSSSVVPARIFWGPIFPYDK